MVLFYFKWLLVASASGLGGNLQGCPQKAKHLLKVYLLEGDTGYL